MKVLLSDTTFSYLSPGGKQVHADKIYLNLKKLDVDVQYENWHDPNLNGNIIHLFGYNDVSKILKLKNSGYKLVYTHILDGLTNLSKEKMKYHAYKNKIIKILPSRFNTMFPWRALKYFDALVYMHENDRKTAINLYNIDPKKTHVIPHAVDTLEMYKGNLEPHNEKFLISIGSIIPRKNPVFLSSICKNNNIPIKFIGHSFDEKSTYFKKFISTIDGTTVQYLDFITEEEKIKQLKLASGFVLLSFGESGCISVYEAGATGLPLLLSDLPWAKGYEDPNEINFCSPTEYLKAEQKIKNFFNTAYRKPEPTFKINNWLDIAKMYKNIYTSLL